MLRILASSANLTSRKFIDGYIFAEALTGLSTVRGYGSQVSLDVLLYNLPRRLIFRLLGTLH